MEKTQFDLLMLALTGLDTKLSGKIDRLEVKMDQLEVKMDQGFLAVHQDIETLATQVNKTIGDVATFNKRVSKLEGPNA